MALGVPNAAKPAIPRDVGDRAAPTLVPLFGLAFRRTMASVLGCPLTMPAKTPCACCRKTGFVRTGARHYRRDVLFTSTAGGVAVRGSKARLMRGRQWT